MANRPSVPSNSHYEDKKNKVSRVDIWIEIENIAEATLIELMWNPQFDLLVHKVLEAGYPHNTKVEYGKYNQVKMIRTPNREFRSFRFEYDDKKFPE